MFAKVLVAPVDSVEAHCAAVSLDAAGVPVTAVPEQGVDAVVLFVSPGRPPVPVTEMFGEDEPRALLLVATSADTSVARLAEDLGASGVVDWSASTDALVEALERVERGESWGFTSVAKARDPLGRLTGRELEVVRLLGEGATNEAISRALGISYHTVRTHVAHVLTKLGVSHRYAVVALARGSERLQPVSAGGAGP